MIRSLLLVAVICTAGFARYGEATNIEPSAIEIIDGKEYFFGPVAENLVDAHSYCNALNKKLVSLDTQKKIDAFTAFFLSEGIADEHWTSGFKIVNTYVWAGKGTLITDSNWEVNEPNYTGSGEAGVTISSNGKWYDQASSQSYKYICEELDPVVCN